MARREFRFPPVQLPEAAERLRSEVRAFIAEELAGGSFTPECDSWLSGFSPEFSRKLGQRGWIGMTWPKEYGGQERTALERFVVTEELLAVGAPVAAHWIGDRQSGPLLLRFGTEEQRQRFLPQIVKGECYFGIGMSEPDSGSDLASIRTSARREGDVWLLTGRKVWTSHAHRANFLIVLARTAPATEERHAGMSQFLVPLDAPGVTVRGIPILTGEHHFNEVLFDDVEIPDELVVGEVGGGWRQVMNELAFERSGPERFLSTYPMLAELVRRVGTAPNDRSAVAIGGFAAKLWTLHRMSLAIASLLSQGIAPELEAAMVKDLGTTFERTSMEIVRQLLPVEPSLSASTRLETLLAEAITHAPGFTLRGGTTEILRGIVARGLGVR